MLHLVENCPKHNWTEFKKAYEKMHGVSLMNIKHSSFKIIKDWYSIEKLNYVSLGRGNHSNQLINPVAAYIKQAIHKLT